MSAKRRRQHGGRPDDPHASKRSAKGTQAEHVERAPVAGWRLWLFRFITVVLGPLVFLFLLELGLRIGGYGYEPHATAPCRVNGVAHRGDNTDFGRRFFPATLAREFEPFVFPARKPAGTYRVFVLGESAAQGVPNHAFCFGRLLQVMLRERFPDTQFEVVTAAMAAINSHVVVEVAEECARYEPDLFVVYMGNNEVVGPYGPGTVLTPALSNLRLIRLGIAMRKTRTGQLLASLAGLAPRAPTHWTGMEMFLGQQVRADDPRLGTVYEHFGRNIEDICRAADGAGAQTILCTVGTNLKDCPPFASLHSPRLTAAQKDAWQRVYQQGVERESRGDHAQAVQSYLEAAQVDDSHAELQFRLAQCHWQLGQYEEAADCFVRARDFDVLRFRADTRINEVIRAVADRRRTQSVHLADAAGALADSSLHGLPGEELFHEHVHLTFEGNYLLARTVFERMESMLADQFKDVRPDESPSLERCAEHLVHSDWSRHQSLDTIVNMFLAKPPFTSQLHHDQRVATMQQRLKALQDRLMSDALQAIAKQYVAAIEAAPADWRLHWDYGKLLAEDLKQYDAAAAQYRIVLSLLPHSYTGHDALGSVLRAKGDLGGAATEYRKVLAIKPTAGATHYYLGLCLHKQGDADKAMSHYGKAIRFSPDCIPAYLSLGELLFQKGQLNEAAEVCRAGLVAAPNHARLHSNLGMLLIKTGHRQEGTEEIITALRLDPNSPQIRRVAETLLGPQAIR